jgi:hypothetical protein
MQKYFDWTKKNRRVAVGMGNKKPAEAGLFK